MPAALLTLAEQQVSDLLGSVLDDLIDEELLFEAEPRSVRDVRGLRIDVSGAAALAILTPGAAVAAIQSAAGRTVAGQSVSSRRPTFDDDYFGLPAFVVDPALNQNLIFDGDAPEIARHASAITVYVVAYHTADTTSSRMMFDFGTASGSAARYGLTKGTSGALRNNVRRLDADALGAIEGGTVALNAWHIYTGTHNWATATSQNKIDNTSVVGPSSLGTTGLTSDTASQEVTMGAGIAGTFPMGGGLYRVLAYDVEHTSDEQDFICSILSDETGITVAGYIAGSSVFTGTATLNGSGTLGTTQTPRPTGIAALTGSGTLATTQAPSPTGIATLSGSGTLGTTGLPAVPGIATLSGSGTLTTTQVPRPTGIATLAGSGSLTTTGLPAFAGAATLSGSGTLTATRLRNLLTLNQASIETDTSGFQTVDANTVIVRSTTRAVDGAASIAMTGAASTWEFWATASAVGTVTPDQTYSCEVSVYATASLRRVVPLLKFYNSSGTLVGSIDATAGNGYGVANGAWTRMSAQGTAPATASYFEFHLLRGGGLWTNGETLWLDNLGVYDGPLPNQWFPPEVPAYTGAAAFAGSGTLASTSAPAIPGNAALSGSGTLSAVRLLNLLTANQASIESDTSGFVTYPPPTVTLVRSTAQAKVGSASLAMSVTPTGETAYVETALSPALITAGQTVSFEGWLRATAASRTGRVELGFYDASGLYLSSISASGPLTSGTWVRFTGQGTVPVDATRFSLSIDEESGSIVSGELVYIDALGVYDGPLPNEWFPPESIAYTGTATLSGSGTLGATGVPAITGAAAGLTGSGTLSTTQTPSPTGTATLSGSGTLTTTQTPRPTGVGTLSGSGTLTTTQVPRPTGTATLTGTGTLSTTATLTTTGTATLAGSGTLSTTATLTAAGAATLSGSGVLSTTTAPAFTTTATLTGSGTLTASGAPAYTAAATLSGSGTLSTAQTPGPVVASALSGSGTLTTTTVPRPTGTATLTGSGILSTAQTPRPTGVATLSGSGTLAATGTLTATGTATLSGSGFLSTTATLTATGTATLAGAGTLTTTATLTVTGAASLTGSGTLTAEGTPGPTAAASLSGSGTLTATASLTAEGSAALTGEGALTAVGVPAFTTTADLTGSGTLAASATPAFTATAALTGSGTLSAVGEASAEGSGTANLTGSGSLTLTTAPAFTTSAALAGSGTLTATGAPSTATSATLTGSGSLTVVGTSARTGNALLTGTGSLTTTAAPTTTGTATLTGSGLLSTTTRPALTAAATLNGTGTLTGSGVTGQFATANLTGTGDLSASGVLSHATTANLTGLGTLHTISLPALVALANLSGLGQLAALGAVGGAADFHGEGTLQTWGYDTATLRDITIRFGQPLTVWAAHVSRSTWQAEQPDTAWDATSRTMWRTRASSTTWASGPVNV